MFKMNTSPSRHYETKDDSKIVPGGELISSTHMNMFHRARQTNSMSRGDDRVAQGKLNPLPVDYIVSNQDVLFGRGRACSDHTGNQIFRSLVLDNLKKYARIETKKEKTRLIQAIINHIHIKEGKFVKFHALTKKYYEVSDSVAHDKISQTFRDTLYMLEKSNEKSDKCKLKRNHSYRVMAQNEIKQSGSMVPADCQHIAKLNIVQSTDFGNFHALDWAHEADSLKTSNYSHQHAAMDQSTLHATEGSQYITDQLTKHQEHNDIPEFQSDFPPLNDLHRLSPLFKNNINFSTSMVNLSLHRQEKIDDFLTQTENSVLHTISSGGQEDASSSNNNDCNSDAVLFNKLAIFTASNYLSNSLSDESPFEPKPFRNDFT